jgi:Signal transduction histidine kinase
MLENYDQDWRSDLIEGKTPPYLNLPAGQYVFKVRGRSSAGVYNFKGSTLHITVLPPWWHSWWAYCFYVVLAAAAIRCYLMLSIRRARRREQLAFEAREMVRIRELDTFRTRLYTNITHEFRTPLTIILGMARQISSNSNRAAVIPTVTATEMIIRNGEQLLQLVNEMLDLSKLENGKMELQAIQADIVSTLRYLVESFHSLAKDKSIYLIFRSDTAVLVMDFDLEKIRQIISNLLANAIKFTPPGGQVDISISSEGGTLSISVQDNGPGISPQKLPYIFDRFYQADDSPTRQAEGTGIGLALVRELVKLMDGRITVNSPPSGLPNGTEFTVELPVHRTGPVTSGELFAMPAVHQSRSVPFIQRPSDKPDPGAPLVLIVEDNADVVAYLSGCLSGYRIVVERDGQAGHKQAVDIIPDIVISDIMMPVMDGFELCRSLKTDERTSHIPVVLLTARIDFESRIEGLEHGADAYLGKPFAPEELLVHLKKLLELRRRLQQHYLQVASVTPSPVAAREVPFLSKMDNAFVQKVREIVEVHLDDYEFNVVQLCREAYLSQRQMNRKLEALTGYSPNAFIRYVRLNKAIELLRNADLTVSMVALECGFSDPSYFGRAFKKEFNLTPAEWRANLIREAGER